MHIKHRRYRSTHSILLTILLAVSQPFLYGYTYHSGKQKYIHGSLADNIFQFPCKKGDGHIKSTNVSLVTLANQCTSQDVS